MRGIDRELNRVNESNLCYGVTIAQCHALLEIEKQVVTNIGDLSAALTLDKSTVSRTVDSLVALDLIDRHIPRENRRTTSIELTKQGKQTCDLINKGNNEFFQKVLKDFEAEKLETFLEHFGSIINKMNAINNKQISKVKI